MSVIEQLVTRNREIGKKSRDGSSDGNREGGV